MPSPTTYAASTFLLRTTHVLLSHHLYTNGIDIADIEPMMLLGPASLPSSEQSAPTVGQGSEFEEPIDDAEVHPRENRRKPRQQPSVTPNESKGGEKERHGREGRRKLGMGDGDSGSDSDEQGNERSDDDGKEHRRSRADSWLPRRWRLKKSTLAMEANRAAGFDGTSQAPAATRKRLFQELHHLSNYPRRVLRAMLGNEAETSDP